MNLKLLLFTSALVACISLSYACLSCLKDDCKNGELCINLKKKIIKPCLLPKYLTLLKLKRWKLLRALSCPNCKGSLDFLNPLCPQHYKLDIVTSKESSEEVVTEASKETSEECSSEVVNDSSEEDILVKKYKYFYSKPFCPTCGVKKELLDDELLSKKYRYVGDFCNKCGNQKLCTCGDDSHHHVKKSVCKCHH